MSRRILYYIYTPKGEFSPRLQYDEVVKQTEYREVHHFPLGYSEYCVLRETDSSDLDTLVKMYPPPATNPPSKIKLGEEHVGSSEDERLRRMEESPGPEEER